MRREQGFGLILAVIVTAFMMLLALSISLSSVAHFSISNELDKQKLAQTTADAAFAAVKNSLRGEDIDTKLQTVSYIPRHIDFTEPTPGTPAHEYYSRNPLPPIEAVHLDFDNPPEVLGYYTVTGLLSPHDGTTFGDGGRYWAKLTDNNDGDGDDSLDSDGLVYLRTLAIQQAGPGQMASYGSSIRSSMAIVEAQLKRDQTFEASAPLTISGPDMISDFVGTSFVIDGYDHSGWSTSDILNAHSHSSSSGSAGIDFVYDNPSGSPPDGEAARNAVYASLTISQQSLIEGPASDYGSTPALRDNTDNLRNSTNQDATNLLNPNFIASLVSRISKVADQTFPHNTDLSSSSLELGTTTDPKILVAEGDLSISGNGSGVGVLVVNGNLFYSGGLQYRGLILVIGGQADFRGVSKAIIGGLYQFHLQGPDADGNYTFGTLDLHVDGYTQFYYSAQDVQVGFSMLPLKMISWREVTPEIEPAY